MPEVMTQSPKIVLKYQGMVLKECVLTKAEFTIGRKGDNDLVVEDGAVSGHHARVVKIQSVYFIEDLQSTNGTFINGQKVSWKQLRDADIVALGEHRLIFLEDAQSRRSAIPPPLESSDKTVVLKGGVPGAPSSGARKMVGVVQVVSGLADCREYRLTRQVAIIGAHPEATIKLTGLFAPKTAAMIGRRGGGYYVMVAGKTKNVKVNDNLVDGQADLKDGDVLEVAGVKMHFSMTESS